MTILVRPARAGELAAVGDLTEAAYAADGLLAEDDYYREKLRDAASRAHAAELYVATVPERPDEPVGTVTYCPTGSPWAEVAGPGEGEFRMLAVLPSARGRGVAQALVSACLERSRELGCRGLVLSSLPEQEAAHRIYRRLGFTRLPARDWSPAPGVDLLAFRLDL